MRRSNLFKNKTSETDTFCNELWKDLDTSKENVPEQKDENLRMEEFMYFRPHLPRGVVNHQFVSITIQADCMYVLGITHHVVVPMETLPIDKQGSYQYKVGGGTCVKRDGLELELFLK